MILLLMLQPASSPVPTSWSGWVLVIFTTLVLGGVVKTFIDGWLTRRKLGADVTQIIERAAAGQLQSYKEDVDRVREQNARLEERERASSGRIDQLERKIRKDRAAYFKLAEDHEAWDRRILQELRRLNPELQFPEPPSLYPSE